MTRTVPAGTLPTTDGATRYTCVGRDCPGRRLLPEAPSTAPETVRVGCEDCGVVRTHYALGSVAHAGLVVARGRYL